MASHDWRLVGEYDMPVYECGLRAGQIVALRRDLVNTDSDGSTGEVRRKGERHRVLHGSPHDPGIVWLLKPDGRGCTWDDVPEIFDWFEVVDEEPIGNPDPASGAGE